MAEVADWNLGWEQSKLRWEESCRKMKELAEQLMVSLGQTAEELKQLREEREALDSEIVDEPLVPSQPEFSKEQDEMPNGCLENAVPGQENTVDAPFSDSEQALNAQKVFSELSHLDSNFGVPSNLGVNLATIQRNVEQPIENPKIEDWDRNILGKPPEDSKEWLILEDAKIVGGGLKTASSSQEKADRSFSCQSEFKKGMYSFPKLDFHVRNAFDFSEKMSFEIEPYEKGELVMLWLDQIRIEMSDSSLISVSSLGIIGALYMFDELPIRIFRSIDPRIQPNNGHWPMGNWIFDPGIPSMISSKWISIVTGNQATAMTKKDCYSWTDFVGFCYSSLVKMTRKIILTFDPGGAFALYATGLVLNSSRGYDSVELLSVFGEFFKSINRASFFSFDPGGVLGMLFTRLALNSSGIVEQQRQQWDPGGSCLFLRNPFPKPIGATLSYLRQENKEQVSFKVLVFDLGGKIQLEVTCLIIKCRQHIQGMRMMVLSLGIGG